MPPSRAARTHGKLCHACGHSVHDLHAFMHGLMSGPHCAQGCMKSGQVLTDRRYKWFEPEYWRFGDPASAEGQINYMRHASGQVRSLSPPQAPWSSFFEKCQSGRPTGASVTLVFLLPEQCCGSVEPADCVLAWRGTAIKGCNEACKGQHGPKFCEEGKLLRRCMG